MVWTSGFVFFRNFYFLGIPPGHEELTVPADESDAALHHQGNGLGGILPREEFTATAGRSVEWRKKKKQNQLLKKRERFDCAHQDHNLLSLFWDSKAAAQGCVKWKSQTLTLQYQGEILWGLPISRKHILAHLGTKKQQIIPKARDTKPGFVRFYYYRKAEQESSYGFNRGIPGEIKGMETKKQQCGSHKPGLSKQLEAVWDFWFQVCQNTESQQF